MFGPLGVESSSRPLARVLVFEVDAPQAPVLISAVDQIAQVDVRPLGRRILLSALGQSTCFEVDALGSQLPGVSRFRGVPFLFLFPL